MIIANKIFDGVGDAKLFERGRFFKPDFDGVVVVKRTIAKQTRAKGPAFIVEMEVLESNHPEHPVGFRGSWFQKLNDKDIAYSALKAWAAACFKFHSHQQAAIDEQLAPVLDDLLNNAAASPDNNDFVGVRLRLVTTLRKTREDKDFTTYDFAPAE
jgi:hypothetical protein